ncbi:hypothetical protein RIR_jg12769.t1 [Rhizophagus irregularis DAOM 181602=DAOM 197198]|nr:hypothetical protein RIR_jg12769.t1 [Rhizophagus irregularis DAOM 181602=DAOM 197198]
MDDSGKGFGDFKTWKLSKLLRFLVIFPQMDHIIFTEFLQKLWIKKFFTRLNYSTLIILLFLLYRDTVVTVRFTETNFAEAIWFVMRFRRGD